MIMQPILVFSAGRDEIRMVYAKAVSRDVVMTIYTEELFSTPNDDANRTAVRAVGSDDLKLVGMALRGRKKPMESLFSIFISSQSCMATKGPFPLTSARRLHHSSFDKIHFKDIGRAVLAA